MKSLIKKLYDKAKRSIEYDLYKKMRLEKVDENGKTTIDENGIITHAPSIAGIYALDSSGDSLLPENKDQKSKNQKSKKKFRSIDDPFEASQE